MKRFRIAGASFVILFLVAGMYLLQKDLGTMISQQRTLLEQAAKTAALWIPAPSPEEAADSKNSQSLRDSQLSDVLFKAELDLLIPAEIDLLDMRQRPPVVIGTTHPRHRIGQAADYAPELQPFLDAQNLGSTGLQWTEGEWIIQAFTPSARSSDFALILHSPQGAFFWSLCRYALHYVLLAVGFLLLGSFVISPLLLKNQKSTAEALVRQNEHLQQKVITDPLTGLLNREFYEHYTSADNLSWVRAAGCCMLVVDLDNFKQVNDTFGHQRGDQILTEFASVLRRFFRKSDKLIRYGGDEFVVLLPGTKLSEGLRISQNFIEVLRKHFFDNSIKLTASVGVAELRDTDIASDWFERADAALYLVKHSGKNSVRSFEVETLEVIQ